MSDYPAAARSVLLFHFHTGSLENKDTGVKRIAPLDGNSPPNASQINLYHVCKKIKRSGGDLNRLVYKLTQIFLPNFIKRGTKSTHGTDFSSAEEEKPSA